MNESGASEGGSTPAGKGSEPASQHPGSGVSRRRFLQGAAAGTGLALSGVADSDLAFAAVNPITTENALAGTDNWDPQWLDDSIEGFANNFSVNAGETIGFKVRTVATSYRIVIYRLGWYGGLGARQIAIINPLVTPPRTQPNPIVSTDTGLVDCGNWSVSANWAVPANAVSGVYVANLERLDTPARNRILFVVRNDGRTSDVLLQTSDTTHQAYNNWGGYSLYGGPATWGRATKVSYNRPYNPSEVENDFFYGEYPLLRWLERNGYDVTYCADLDTHSRPAELLKHKVYMSSGHDEYWSGAMRSNVEAARDAGVNLVFMTGNEIFWRVRFEPSVDGTNTPFKTLVCYKETLANAKIDPSSEWTGTWRDNRFAPPSIGGTPENALTGTLFRAINPLDATDFSIEVPAAYRQLRIWRNTNITSLTPGTKATLGLATLGYEWDADTDNGYRPKGLIRLSETTQVAEQVLQDWGATYIKAPLTHHMTLYRAASGALVWGLGTNQWAWGLDTYHSNRPTFEVPVDVRIQQATLNVLADMGVQPATRMAGLAAATKSTDTLPPTSTITAPASGATGPVGSPVTVTGTAVDSGGGVVGGVEVSVDGGTTWHPAAGTATWTYTFVPTKLGSLTIRSRATDDSCNTETPSPGRTFVAGQRALPCSIWNDSSVPAVAAFNDPGAYELGVKFRVLTDGFITGIRYYQGAGNTGAHVGNLWSGTGALLGTVNFANSDTLPAGWRTASFGNAIPVRTGNTYVASYFAPNGHYSGNTGYFASAYELHPLRALASGEDGANGVFRSGTGFPTLTYGASNYWVDVVFNNDNNAPPSLVDRSPSPGTDSVEPIGVVTATFNEAVNPTTIVFGLTGPSGAVAGTKTYDAATLTARFTPTASLAAATTYSATISGAVDLSGTPMAAPITWTFTTAGPVGALPTSLWTSATAPTNAAGSDTSPVEVGVRITSDVDALARGIRFYKGTGNGGVHTGHLWALNGTLLGTVTFASESATGWQQANFSSPIPITRNTVYVVSYLAPSGHYAVDSGFFASQGVARGPLRALSGPAAGGNGVYVYGPTGGFPTSSYGSSNYWVDLVIEGRPDSTPPNIANVVPAPGLWSVAIAAPIVVTFDEAVDVATAVIRLTGPGNAVVPSAIAWTDATTAVLTPTNPLVRATTYSMSASAKDLKGNAMAQPYVWSFVTEVAAGATPATIWNSAATPATPAINDPGAVELGVKISVDVAGSLVGVRFHKGPGNVGPHVGHVWASDGTLLGTAAFTNESATGWQQALLDPAVPVTPGQVYVVSYHAPSGRYSHNANGLASAVQQPPIRTLASGSSGGNGVFRYGAGSFPNQSYGSANYWVDAVFVDNSAPTLVSTAPAAGAVGIAPSAAVSVTFNEPLASITMELRDPTGALVPATKSHDPASASAMLQPNGPLASATTFTASVVAATDLQGNNIAAPVSWSFTTLDSSVFTLFGSTVPATQAANDSAAVELGMKFRVTAPATLLGVRFFKGAGNTGNHVGRLWSDTGALLAELNYTNETATGWQSALLPAPLTLQPGTVYVVSYLAPVGRYAVTGGYFNPGDVTNGILVGLGNAPANRNGVYVYGGGFPSSSYGGSNYWVDVIVRATN